MTTPLRIGALLGEACGVGPEMMVRLLSEIGARQNTAYVLIADPDALALGQAQAKLKLPLKPIANTAAPLAAGEIGFLALPKADSAPYQIGSANAESGAATLAAFNAAVAAAARGDLHGICFAPMNKHALRLGGMTAEDELRHVQERLGVASFVCEFNVTRSLWTSRVTSHIPLREVAAALTAEGIDSAVRIIDKSLRAAGITAPRIGVCGLNPHAGDGGSIGREEIELIAPALEPARRSGLNVEGPLPADTIFVAAKDGRFDGVVTMYHDQGQIAMKLMDFANGITVLGGLPIPITTSASGSAFDIAGKGIARIEGLRHAMETCARMADSARIE